MPEELRTLSMRCHEVWRALYGSVQAYLYFKILLTLFILSIHFLSIVPYYYILSHDTTGQSCPGRRGRILSRPTRQEQSYQDGAKERNFTQWKPNCCLGTGRNGSSRRLVGSELLSL
jgi:hypothetical protein